MSYKDQILNTDCICCCKKSQPHTQTQSSPSSRQCCFSGWSAHSEIFISEYDTVGNNNDACCTCFCTLLCIVPKCVLTSPYMPFTCYNYLRNKCNKTENNNYVC